MAGASSTASEPTRGVSSRVSRLWRAAQHTLRLAWSASPRDFTLITIGTLGTACLAPLQIALTAWLIDAIATALQTGTRAGMTTPVVALGALVMFQRAVDNWVARQQEIFADRVVVEAHAAFLHSAAHADAALLEDPQWRDQVARAQRDVGWRPHSATMMIMRFVSSATTLFALMAGLAALDVTLLALALLAVAPFFAARFRVNERMYALFWKQARREREHDYVAGVAAGARFAKEVRAYDWGDRLVARVRALATSRLDDKRALYRRASVGDLTGGVVSGAILVFAYFHVADAAFASHLSLGQVAAVLAAFAAVSGQLSGIANAFLALDQHAPFLLDVFAFLQRPAPQRVQAALTSPLNEVHLRNVDFTYPHANVEALRGVDFAIRRGEIVAVVGANGAGKTTLVKLLLRFFDPTQGQLLLNGVDARTLDPAALRARMGVLFQDFAHIELEVRENLALGRAAGAFDEAAAAAAIADADAATVVADVGGMDAVVGRVLDGGRDLSGGQWQRLALARLFYRDADLWVLDEPTAHLDADAEAHVFAALRARLRDRMAVVISHRFSTVRSADRIVVMDAGRIAEQGSHDALIAAGGLYARLFAEQAAGYR